MLPLDNHSIRRYRALNQLRGNSMQNVAGSFYFYFGFYFYFAGLPAVR